VESGSYRKGERLWLCGREVVFVDYRQAGYDRRIAPRIGVAVVQREDEPGTLDVPLWILARDRDESVSRANAVPAHLIGCDFD
jgi:hypothetical protein